MDQNWSDVSAHLRRKRSKTLPISLLSQLRALPQFWGVKGPARDLVVSRHRGRRRGRRGIGYRRIAAQLGRPTSTVGRWVRAVREDHHAEWLRDQGVGWITRVDREVLATLTAESTRLGEALTALAAAAVTVRARLAPHVPPWTLIGQFTHGRLITPASTG